MRHYGAEPPWEGEGELGRWVRVETDSRLWIREEPYWEWRPERTTTEKLNDLFWLYAQQMADVMNEQFANSILLKELE